MTGRDEMIDDDLIFINMLYSMQQHWQHPMVDRIVHIKYYEYPRRDIK